MGQVTQATIDMTRERLERGEWPNLTQNEYRQLCWAWERQQKTIAALEEAKRLFDLLRADASTFSGKPLQDRVYEAASDGEIACLRALFPERSAEWDAIAANNHARANTSAHGRPKLAIVPTDGAA